MISIFLSINYNLTDTMNLVQDTVAIQYTDGRKINLKLLKN